jgi:hypothetical protein
MVTTGCRWSLQSVVLLGVAAAWNLGCQPDVATAASGGAAASHAPSSHAAAPSGSVVRKRGLPTWDETKPPTPSSVGVLVVDAAGYCYKSFEPGTHRLEGVCHGNHCGVAIECPKGASALSRGGKAEVPESEAVAAAASWARGAGRSPSGVAKATLFASQSEWVVAWPSGESARIDAISGSVR